MLRNLSGPTYGIVSWEIFLDLEKLGLLSTNKHGQPIRIIYIWQ